MGSYFFHNFQNHISPIAGGQMFWTSKAKIGATGRVIIPVSKKFDHIIEDWTWNIERSHVTVLWKGFDWFDLNNYVAHFVAGHAQKVVCSDQQWTEFANVSGSFSRTSSCLQGKKKNVVRTKSSLPTQINKTKNQSNIWNEEKESAHRSRIWTSAVCAPKWVVCRLLAGTAASARANLRNPSPWAAVRVFGIWVHHTERGAFTKWNDPEMILKSGIFLEKCIEDPYFCPRYFERILFEYQRYFEVHLTQLSMKLCRGLRFST